MIAGAPVAQPDNDEAFAALLRKIERASSLPCASYKDRCLRRRIGVRMRATAVHSFGDYSRLLDRTPPEWEKLMAALTINVTKFFRDASAFGALESQAYPLLSAQFPGQLRVWSAGCSHGQEPYSLAMGMADQFELGRFRIQATDIDSDSLTAAAAGLYSEEMLVGVSEARRAKWMTGETTGTVRPSLRGMVTVTRHDLLSESIPEQRYHLITCRNVIIYFSRDAQQQLFLKMFDALVPGGLLMLGKVETLVGQAREQFTTINMRERLFQRPLA